ncbi:MAG: hypothetical protein IK120_06650 [Muribaculaceae bacterium]|nr:hypothetical protein [Muribaculaceae bacterium]MBR5436527.1 hypothetical protein [Muribaculaceae bacterium]
MKKTVLALLVFALCGISLPSCGDNDEPVDDKSVGRYEVTYSLQVTQDLIDLLDAQCHYRDEKGELQSFIVSAPNLGEKIVFTIFPTEFGFDLMAKNKKSDVVLTKDSYSFGFIAKIDVKIYSKSGELLHDLPGYYYKTKTTPCSKANVDKLLDKYVNEDPVFFSSFTDIDKDGNIVTLGK